MHSAHATFTLLPILVAQNPSQDEQTRIHKNSTRQGKQLLGGGASRRLLFHDWPVHLLPTPLSPLSTKL